MSSPLNEASDTSNSSVRKRVVHIDPLEITQSLGFQTFRKGQESHGRRKKIPSCRL